MAMTKAEKAKMDALVQKVRVLGALRWTSPVPPDVLPPSNGAPFGTTVTGYVVKGAWYDSMRPVEAWSQAHRHGEGDASQTRYWASQNGRAMHSTKVLALKARRHEVEWECARILAGYDAMIEALEQEGE